MAIDRAALRTRARARADQDNSTFATDTQYNLWIDEGSRDVWADLIGAGWPIDYSSTTITANGAASYAIAGAGGSSTAVFTIMGVYFLMGSEQYELKRANSGALASLRSQPTAGNYAEFYDIRFSPALGLIIELLPKPTSGSYRVDYVPEFQGLVNDAAVWFGPIRSDELVVLRVAAKALIKEGDDRGAYVLEQEYTRMLEKVTAQASWLDMRNPPQIRDVRTRQSRGIFDYMVAGQDMDY